MRIKRKQLLIVTVSGSIIILATACSYKFSSAQQKQTASIPNLPEGVRVDFPANLKHSSRLPPNLPLILTIPAAGDFYVGSKLVPGEKLETEISQAVKLLKDSDKIVYLAAGTNVDYGTVLGPIYTIRKQHIEAVGLLVGQRSAEDNEAPNEFLVSIAGEQYDLIPDPTRSRPLPNPLTLVVTISQDLKLKLNNREKPESGEPCYGHVPEYGSANDPGHLALCLNLIFRLRTEQHAYKPGMETRTDITEDQRIEKAVFIKAPRSSKYGDVVRVIDVLKYSGATPVGLVIDDLPQ